MFSLPKIETDKLYHFVTCFAITLFVTLFLVCAEVKFEPSITIGLSVGLAAGVFKELYDKFIKLSSFDVYDLIADVAGVTLAGFFFLAFKMLVISIVTQ